MKKWMQAALAGAALGMVTQGALAASQGFYIGVGAGQGIIADGTNLQIDLESDVGYTGVFGYRLGVIPLFDFAVEGFYNDLGEFTPKNGSTNVKADASAYGANALAILPLGPVDLFAKVGAARLDFDVTMNGTTTKYSSTNPVYGVGLGFRLWSLGFRLQADYYDPEKDVGESLGTYSAIVTWTF